MQPDSYTGSSPPAGTSKGCAAGALAGHALGDSGAALRAARSAQPAAQCVCRGHQRLPAAGAGGDFTAKDFRTWHATVVAAVGLAVSRSAAVLKAGRKRAVAWVARGGGPCLPYRPRIIGLYEEDVGFAPVLADLGSGRDFGDMATKGAAERAVLWLLTARAPGQRPQAVASVSGSSRAR
jgi:hypothetical protein